MDKLPSKRKFQKGSGMARLGSGGMFVVEADSLIPFTNLKKATLGSKRTGKQKGKGKTNIKKQTGKGKKGVSSKKKPKASSPKSKACSKKKSQKPKP